MKSVEDVEVQKKGIVTLYYGLDQVEMKPPKDWIAARDSLPVKGAANHFAFNDPKLRPFLPILEGLMSVIEHSRFRSHYGTHLEVQYSLMTFGIPKENFPVSSDGTVYVESFLKRNAHLLKEYYGHAGDDTTKSADPNMLDKDNSIIATQSINNATRNEENTGDDNGGNVDDDDGLLPISFTPGPHDVVMGRFGRKAAGNLKLKQLLEEYREQYDAASFKMEKMVMTHHIFTTIKERGGKFVNERKKEKGDTNNNNNNNTSARTTRWEEVSDETAREKIALGFRNLRRPAAAINTGGRGGHQSNSAKKRRAVGS